MTTSIHLQIISGHFHPTTAELSSCDKGKCGSQAYNICSLVFTGKNMLTPGLEVHFIPCLSPLPMLILQKLLQS
jgi:hypothetical protein